MEMPMGFGRCVVFSDVQYDKDDFNGLEDVVGDMPSLLILERWYAFQFCRSQDLRG